MECAITKTSELTNNLMVAVPYRNTKHRADVEVRELVCLEKIEELTLNVDYNQSL